ncbi:tRNA lysidine(34) synthetase TilS [Roseovarius faecimaris]|uniref:tRNA lysidine(34) synthetase TilS n=1 Tax=Roseovarius faecimaris TaxID=2494550 RepID=UPI001FE5AF99|nr:tRNA lysidine(34) synthetase TilS [Roseovarius faecimaris]
MSGGATPAFQQIAAHFAPDMPQCLGVAVSGGSDSLGLLTLLHDWALAGGPALRAVTVDHGLRPEAAQEAEAVARVCAGLDLPHNTLRIEISDQAGNVMDMARRGRYAALAQWAKEHRLSDIALGHTSDDLAETFLMRLSREAGLSGLSAMTARRVVDGVTFHRPLLSVSRMSLRDLLTGRGVDWVEDPTNDDPAYDRTRARAILKELAPLGISAGTLASVACNLREADEALRNCACKAAEDIVQFDAGDVVLARDALFDQPGEILRALLLAALNWVGNEGYPPRGSAMSDLIEQARDGKDRTLQGCSILSRASHLRICREWKAVAETRCATSEIWDGRWQLHGPHQDDLHIGALGEAGLPLCPDRKETGRPSASLIASPAVWRGTELIAAPLAGLANGWSATLLREEDSFTATLLSH